MMRHRVYRLGGRVSLLGLELADWFIILIAWLALKQLAGPLGSRLSLFIAGVGTFLAFRLWQRVKDAVPERFAAHLMVWMIEADVYCLGPDIHNAPLIVETKAAKRITAPEVAHDLTHAKR